MLTTLTLSAEAWAAIGLIVTPLVAAFAANMNLSAAVKALTAEMKDVKEAMAKIPAHEGRLLSLENRLARQRKK